MGVGSLERSAGGDTLKVVYFVCVVCLFGGGGGGGWCFVVTDDSLRLAVSNIFSWCCVWVRGPQAI